MREITVGADSILNLSEAYHKALTALFYNGESSYCGDWDCMQTEVAMTIVVRDPLGEPMISRLFPGGPIDLQQYVYEMMYGILDFEVDAGKWNYTYHRRMVDFGGKNQLDFVIDELKRNPTSRRAVISIRTPEDVGSNDPACLQSIQYFVRDNRLDCVVLFRSNDACKATFMNMFALISLQKYIADQLNVEIGTYTHRANSFHCYSRDYDTLLGYYRRISSSYKHRDTSGVTYSYADEFKELMEDSKPLIEKKVSDLYRKSFGEIGSSGYYDSDREE